MHTPSDTPPDSYLTLASGGASELRVQRSRFLGLSAPAGDEAAARAWLADVARRYHDARHVCHGWRLGAPPATCEGRNDDGEPSGTAGEPILAAIRGAGLCDCVVAVVRYFGGVKLGTGGLARAYGQAADEALAAAPRRTVLQGRRFRLVFPYARQKTVGHVLAGHGGRVEAEDYAADVTWQVWLPHSTWRACGAQLHEITHGAVDLGAPLPD